MSDVSAEAWIILKASYNNAGHITGVRIQGTRATRPQCAADEVAVPIELSVDTALFNPPRHKLRLDDASQPMTIRKKGTP